MIGAGPAGSYLAHKMAWLGYDVVVLEKRAGIGNTCCTGIISKDCYNMLLVDPSLILREANSARFFAPSGRFLRLQRDTIQTYIIDRSGLDCALFARAQETGAKYLLSVTVEDIIIQEGHVQVLAYVRHRPRSFKARAVAIAAGSGSKLTQRLSLGKVNDFGFGAQSEVISKVDEVEIFLDQELAPGFFAWIVPTSGDRARVGLLCQHRPRVYFEFLLDRLKHQGKIGLTDDTISYGSIPLKPLAKTYGHRVIVIGDAAGQVKPTTGGGIYYGLLCAEIAAQTLHQGFAADDLSAKQLSRYHREWHKLLGKELKTGYWARRFYQKLDNRQIEHIFHIIESNDIHESVLASPDISFDWHSNIILNAIKHKSLQRALKLLRTMPLKYV